eukprot:2435776-Pyramimonas_sp.AAC.1
MLPWQTASGTPSDKRIAPARCLHGFRIKSDTANNDAKTNAVCYDDCLLRQRKSNLRASHRQVAADISDGSRAPANNQAPLSKAAPRCKGCYKTRRRVLQKQPSASQQGHTSVLIRRSAHARRV